MNFKPRLWKLAVVFLALSACGPDVVAAEHDAKEGSNAALQLSDHLHGRPVDRLLSNSQLSGLRYLAVANTKTEISTLTISNHSGFRVTVSGSGTCGGGTFTLANTTLANGKTTLPFLMMTNFGPCKGGSEVNIAFTQRH